MFAIGMIFFFFFFFFFLDFLDLKKDEWYMDTYCSF
jgi:hypothetical protein